MVPHVRGVPGPARRHRGPRARAAGGGPGVEVPPRRAVDRSRGLPRRPAGPPGRARSRGPERAAGRRPVVRPTRLAAPRWRDARAQPARGAPRRVGTRRGLERRVHAGLLRTSGAAPAALRRLRPRTLRLLAGERQRARAARADLHVVRARRERGARLPPRPRLLRGRLPPRGRGAGGRGPRGGARPPRGRAPSARAAHERHRPHAPGREHRRRRRGARAAHGRGA